MSREFRSPLITLSVTITRCSNACSPKLNVMLAGASQKVGTLFCSNSTFSLDSLILFSPKSLMFPSSHQHRASEVGGGGTSTMSIWILVPGRNNKSHSRNTGWIVLSVSQVEQMGREMEA